MKRDFTVPAMCEHSDKTDTILMFASHIGGFNDGELKGELYAIGNTARITFEGLAGYIDIDLGHLVGGCLEWMKANTEVVP